MLLWSQTSAISLHGRKAPWVSTPGCWVHQSAPLLITDQSQQVLLTCANELRNSSTKLKGQELITLSHLGGAQISTSHRNRCRRDNAARNYRDRGPGNISDLESRNVGGQASICSSHRYRSQKTRRIRPGNGRNKTWPNSMEPEEWSSVENCD